jgi:hypothetical protein
VNIPLALPILRLRMYMESTMKTANVIARPTKNPKNHVSAMLTAMESRRKAIIRVTGFMGVLVKLCARRY